MLGLGIRYLRGVAVATDPGDRERAEWPPHPDRVFMALAAAHFETGAEPSERRALEWLEIQSPPQIAATGHSERTPVTAFVPVNDDSSPLTKKGQPRPIAGSLPVGRDRQARQFPTAVPHGDLVELRWPDATPEPPIGEALQRLCEKVACIGHSSSLVEVWVMAEASDSDPDLVPMPDGGSNRLRVPARGRLADLEARFAAGRRPSQAPWSGYGPPPPEADEPPRRSAFSPDLVVLRGATTPRLGLPDCATVAARLRDAAMSHATQPPPEWISGHREDGGPSTKPHLAFLPLADVAHDHSGGHLMGMALALPRSLEERQLVALSTLLYEGAASREIELTLGRHGVWRLRLEDRDLPPRALRASTWTADPTGAERWASVTPIVLDRYPKAAGDAEETVAAACEAIGLPRPADVVVTKVSLHLGVPVARDFPPFRRQGGGRRFHVHVVLRFSERVVGPILLGAGRYRGYGLCRPLTEAGR